MILLGAFDVLNSGGGSNGFSLDSDDFDAPDHSGTRCNVESYTIYAMYNTAIAATLGSERLPTSLELRSSRGIDPTTIIANGIITADINITYSGLHGIFIVARWL